MANVWDRLPKKNDPYREAFKAEWGVLGRLRFEWHREKAARLEDPDRGLLWRRSQRPEGIRNLIAGFLVIEGVVALLVGLGLMLAYWPPVENGAMADPIGFAGLGIVGASLAYMLVVGLGLRLYNQLRPPVQPLPLQSRQNDEPQSHHDSGRKNPPERRDDNLFDE